MLTEKKERCPKCYSDKFFNIRWDEDTATRQCVRCDHEWTVSMTYNERMAESKKQ